MPDENVFAKFLHADLDKPGVTGLAKKHERLILFAAAMLGVIMFVLYLKNNGTNAVGGTSANGLTGLTGGLTGGSDTGTTGTSTTGTTSTVPPISFGYNSSSDNGLNYIGSDTKSTASGGGISILSKLFGGGSASGYNNSSDTKSRTVQSADTFASTVAYSGNDPNIITNIINAVSTQQGTFEERSTAKSDFLNQAKTGAPA